MAKKIKRQVWLTTIDNPFDPFDQYDDWKRFDEDHGYFTDSKVCRVMNNEQDFDDETFSQFCEDAVDTLLELNPYGIYRKAVKETEVETDD